MLSKEKLQYGGMKGHTIENLVYGEHSFSTMGSQIDDYM